MSYLTRKNYRQRDQREPIRDDQVENRAGGFVWQVDKWSLAQRFLVLGSESGTYYVSEHDLTKSNTRNLEECIKEDGVRFVQLVSEMRDRVPKRETIFYAIAMAFAHGDAKTKDEVHSVFTDIVRTGSDLFQFVNFVNKMRGWGRSLQKLVARWYDHHAEKGSLEYQVVKYQNRNDWSHRDVLRKSHYGMHGGDSNTALMRWIAKQTTGIRTVTRQFGDDRSGTIRGDTYPATDDFPAYIRAFEHLKGELNPQRTCTLIREHGFTHEMIPNSLKNTPKIWETLLEKMPITAMVRNLGKMTNVGAIKPLSETVTHVTNKLAKEVVNNSKIHPFQLLTAYLTYKNGAGVLGSLNWKPVPQIVDALENAFYHAFDNVEPTGKRILIGIDVSGSMGWGTICNCPGLTPSMASAALAMITARSESQYHIMGYSHKVVELDITANMTLDEATRNANRSAGGTQCSLPILYAAFHALEVDLFLILTDNETWGGDIHPSEALKAYRAKFNPEARLAVVAMEADEFSIADPTDPGMIDIAGFDSATPTILADFAKGLV